MHVPEKLSGYIPGITVRSLGAILLSMLLMGMYVQYAEIIQVSRGAIGEQAIPVPAITVFLLVLLVAALLQVAVKYQILNRQERFCVLISLLIAAPMMTQGMWHRFVGIIAASPREGNFHYMDAFNDKLWPHGPNLLHDRLDPDAPASIEAVGNVEWREIEYAAGESAMRPVLVNENSEELSYIGFTLDLHDEEGNFLLQPGQPYLVSFLGKPTDLQSESYYFIRLYEDDKEDYSEVVNSREQTKKTFLHQTGFLRVGRYNVVVPPTIRKSLEIRIGLQGAGTLAVTDPKFFSVAALEGVYKGRRIIGQAAFDQLSPNQQVGLIVKPNNMFSLAGLKFLITGYIPVRDWWNTAVAWSVPICLLLAAMLAIGVIMRRQWAENERYPFPLFQIPYSLNGEADEAEDKPLPSIWKMRIMWIGFGVGLCYALLKGWHYYNPEVPFKEPTVALSQYIDSPWWGGMWNVTFGLSLLLISIAIFFELNVLLSLVVGFFLYRSLFILGNFFNWKVISGYPFRYEQSIGAYLAYAAVVLFFTRKYIFRIFRYAFSKRNKEASAGEAFSYRTAFIVLAVAFLGAILWALWLNVSVIAIVVYFAFLVTIGFVAAKLKSECGLPVGYFTPYNAMLFIGLLGGMTAFGPGAVLVCLIASGFLTVSVFFFIPGTQVELLEFGRRYKLVPRHLIYTCILGIAGGLFIGGWVFLSNSYAIGGDNIKYQWSYSQGWFFRSYMTQLADATSQVMQDKGAASQGILPVHWAYIGAGVLTVIVATLRQLFAGFWFHPIGIILGSAHMLEWAWGSVLFACGIRWTVLKLGGAATVKNKLFPFFIGVFLGCIVSILIFVIYGAYLQDLGIVRIYSELP